MNDAQILARLRDRDRLLAVVLESERDQGWPAPFDWRAWRLNRAGVVAKVRARTYWANKGFHGLPRVIHSSVDK